MLKVVCNASPIIGLSIIDKINLLWELFDVTIPKEVFNEIVNASNERTIGHKELSLAIKEKNINIYEIKDNEFVEKAYGILHKGELEVIVAALENNIKVVIIDEKTARNFAKTLNLKPLGIIGILKLAKEKGKISCIKDPLDKLIKNKYRISISLYNKVLKDSDEL